MKLTPRENMKRCLDFETPERIPRDLWLLPWATNHYPDEVARIQERFPPDIGKPPEFGYRPSSVKRGDPYNVGRAVDDWGCVFVNIQEGVHGEVQDPILPDLNDLSPLRPPYETLPSDVRAARDTVNRYCADTDLFVLANACPRPWERYQFLRGTGNAMMDMAVPDEPQVQAVMKAIQDYYLKELEFWVSTDIDAIMFMDDWGSQRNLLISPQTWKTVFKPLYKEYCDLAHSRDKYSFMHSDGHILDIYRDLAEVGVDAINSQLFCMDLARVAEQAKGRITFWGEIDRQNVVPSKDPEVGRAAVRDVAKHLYDPRGGVIAQLEFGPGGNPATIMAVYEEWEKVR